MNQRTDSKLPVMEQAFQPSLGARSRSALVAVLMDGSQPVANPPGDFMQWKRTDPLTDWIRIDMQEAPYSRDGAWLQRKLSDLLARKQMQFGHLVLVGRGNTGRLGLDIILDGTIECAGIVGIDIPCLTPPIAITATTTSIRLVLHQDETNPTNGADLIGVLRSQDVDTRIMRLPFRGDDVPEVTARAAEVFLFELVAKACRYSVHNKGSHYV